MQVKKLPIRLDESISGHVQKKWPCPSCGKKRFVKFYDFNKGEYLEDQFGRCDRSDNCGYYHSPYSAENFRPGKSESGATFTPAPVLIDYVDKDVVVKTLTHYEQNNFVQFLISRVGLDRAIEACYRFFIGTAKGNGTIFWQVDQFMMIRTGSKIFYLTDGHRDKNNLPSKLFKLEYDIEHPLYGKHYRSCLFGLHQLFTEKGDYLIGIVESEKTATLASMYMPDVAGRKIVWMAASGSNGLTNEKIAPLRGRDVLLVPDFSFHARATWGLVPMRKKHVDKIIGGQAKQILLPHPDGDIVEFESAADRLRAIGCAVSFFDPFPGVDDGSDIADTFVTETAPDEFTMPEFGALELRLEDGSDQRGQIKPVDELSLSDRVSILSGRHSLKLVRQDSATFEIRANNDGVKSAFENTFMKNSNFMDLIERFGLDEGHIKFGVEC